MKIVVMGGTGFIGKHFCEAINRYGKNATSISRHPDVQFLKKYAPSVTGISIYSEHVWEEIRSASCIVYLSSSTKPSSDWRSPSGEIAENVSEFAKFTRNLFDCNPSCHLIYASSGGSIYGQAYSSPINEDRHTHPSSSYALGKNFSEDILKFHSRIEGSNITILRISNPVGRWQLGGKHGMVSFAVDACLKDKELHVFGAGSNVRDYFDADELAELLIDVSERPGSGLNIYNVGSGIGYTEIEIINQVQSTIKKEINYKFCPPRPFDIDYSVLDSQKIYNHYGWRSNISLDGIVEKLYRSAIDFGYPAPLSR